MRPSLFRRGFATSIAWLFFLLLWASGGRALAEPRTVRIATDDAAPPFSHVQDGKAEGLYLKLVRRAAEALPGWRLEFKPMPWARALREAELAEADALLPPYHGMGRDWIAHYVSLPYREQVVLSCSTTSGLGAGNHWPQDFGGRRIGVNRGYLIGPTVVEAVQRGWIHKVEFRNGRDALAALASGQIDCYANERISIEVTHKQALADKLWGPRMPAQLRPALALSEQQAYLVLSRQALAKRPELAQFARELESQLSLLHDSGELQRLLAEMGEKH